MKIDLDQIRDLLAVVGSTDITELTIEFGDQRITVKKSGAVAQMYTDMPMHQMMAPPPMRQAPAMSFDPKPAAPAPAPAPAAAAEPAAANNNFLPVTSPMVGTFYSAPSPTAAAFVKVGDHINVGQTVCIIEAMKLMNDMPTEVAGKVVKICVENGSTVEYGQPLFLVDPKG